MTVRTRRRPMVFTKVFPNGQVLKVRFKPQMLVGQSCVWNISSAIGKSHRQLNDWEKKRKNKRAKKLRNLMSGRVGAASLALLCVLHGTVTNYLLQGTLLLSSAKLCVQINSLKFIKSGC